MVPLCSRRNCFELYKRPLLPLLEKESQPLGGAESDPNLFSSTSKISAVTGIFIGLPFLLRELWAFLVPALSRDEKRASLPFLLAGTLCFMGGVLFCYFLVLPAALTVLHGLLPPAVHASYSMALFFNFITAMLLAFGLAFDLPVLMVSWQNWNFSSRLARSVPPICRGRLVRARSHGHSARSVYKVIWHAAVDSV